MENSYDDFYPPQVYESLGCTLQISGIGFNPEAYLSKSSFTRNDIIFAGVLGVPDKIRTQVNVANPPEAEVLTLFDTPFLLLKISEAVDVSVQIMEAISFLKNHQTDLISLQYFKGVESISMKFLSEKNENLSNFRDFPPDFYNLISKLEIESIMIG